MSTGTDFVALRRTFDSLTPGQQAELRRVAEPEDLRDTPALYRLFPGEPIWPNHLRVAFLLPWCEHTQDPPALGRQLLDKNIAEARVLQVARAESPIDLIQFRRVLMHAEPRVNWADFGNLLWYWGAKTKRKIVENFYLAKFEPAKGAKK